MLHTLASGQGQSVKKWRILRIYDLLSRFWPEKLQRFLKECWFTNYMKKFSLWQYNEFLDNEIAIFLFSKLKVLWFLLVSLKSPDLQVTTASKNIFMLKNKYLDLEKRLVSTIKTFGFYIRLYIDDLLNEKVWIWTQKVFEVVTCQIHG